ncbi:MAG: glycosyltransferase family 4 protein [Candidatus Omnitrophota bacterium]
MRIALVSLQFEETATGGGGVHVEHICEQFLKKGHQVTVLSIHTAKTLHKGIKLQEWDIPYSIQKKGHLTVIRFLIDEGIEQPYSGDKDAELSRIKKFADAATKWIKIFEQKFDVVNLHGHHILPGYMAKELQNMPFLVVSTIHALETTYMIKEGEFVGAFDGTKEVLAKIREWESMCRYADYIIVNSPLVHSETKDIIAEFDGKTNYENKLVLISSGCNKDFLMSDKEVEKKLAEKPEVINLITFCRIDPSKGVEFSIEGARRAAVLSPQKYSLTIAGIPDSSEYEKQLKNSTGNLPNNLKVIFNLRSAISPVSEKKQILDDKHIYILPTLKEPFGMSVIEASARGNMIVSADTNGPKFMFESESGEVFDWGVVTRYGVLANITENHYANFAQNIGKAVNWVVENWQKSTELVLNFNNKVRKIWTWESIGEEYLKLFLKESSL